MPSPDMEDESRDEMRKVRSFRIGVMRRVGEETVFKPAALIGLAGDGGVFVLPYHPSSAWAYGLMRGDVPVDAAKAVTRVRPKLHYHRSGMVFPTLTGHDLERRALALTPLPKLRNTQIFSIMSMRTWELPSRRAQSMQPGDSATAVKRWPDVAMWGVFLVEASADDRRPLLIPGLGGHGLLAGQTFTHRVVSLAAHGREAVLLVTVQLEDSYEGLPRVGGTTIAALPWHAGRPRLTDEAFGLWSADLRNPSIHWDPAAPADLVTTSTTSERRLDDDVDRMAEFTVPPDGLPLRSSLNDPNDFADTVFARPDNRRD